VSRAQTVEKLKPAVKKTIEILIVDGHAIVREGLRAFISTEPGMNVVGEAADGETAVEQCLELQPDVTLMDLVLPNNEGFDAIRNIKHTCPRTTILVLTNLSDEERVLAAMKAGAQGYMLKDATTQDIIRAIRDVYNGKVVLHPSVAHVLLVALQTQNETHKMVLRTLTDRETQVLQLVAQGYTNQEIASHLEIDERTVRVHVTHVLQKLDLNNRTQAALFALRYGLAALE
jgi:DNA-binding NarL/FixJ family response regulator